MLELKGITTRIDVRGSFIGDKEWSSEAPVSYTHLKKERQLPVIFLTASGDEFSVNSRHKLPRSEWLGNIIIRT